MDMKRLWRQKSLYTLAQIAAILSGTWIVGAGMFLNMGFGKTALTYNLLDSAISNNESISKILLDAAVSVNSAASASYDFHTRLFYIAFTFGLIALFAWFVGSMLED